MSALPVLTTVSRSARIQPAPSPAPATVDSHSTQTDAHAPPTQPPLHCCQRLVPVEVGSREEAGASRHRDTPTATRKRTFNACGQLKYHPVHETSASQSRIQNLVSKDALPAQPITLSSLMGLDPTLGLSQRSAAWLDFIPTIVFRLLLPPLGELKWSSLPQKTGIDLAVVLESRSTTRLYTEIQQNSSNSVHIYTSLLSS